MKTIEQAAEEYADSLILGDAHHVSQQQFEEYAQSDFKAGVEFAQRWIPVEEESPAEYDYVIAKSSVGDVYVASFSAGTFHTGMPHKVNITHWRPIEYK